MACLALKDMHPLPQDVAATRSVGVRNHPVGLFHAHNRTLWFSPAHEQRLSFVHHDSGPDGLSIVGHAPGNGEEAMDVPIGPIESIGLRIAPRAAVAMGSLARQACGFHKAARTFIRPVSGRAEPRGRRTPGSTSVSNPNAAIPAADARSELATGRHRCTVARPRDRWPYGPTAATRSARPAPVAHRRPVHRFPEFQGPAQKTGWLAPRGDKWPVKARSQTPRVEGSPTAALAVGEMPACPLGRPRLPPHSAG